MSKNIDVLNKVKEYVKLGIRMHSQDSFMCFHTFGRSAITFIVRYTSKGTAAQEKRDDESELCIYARAPFPIKIQMETN